MLYVWQRNPACLTAEGGAGDPVSPLRTQAVTALPPLGSTSERLYTSLEDNKLVASLKAWFLGDAEDPKLSKQSEGRSEGEAAGEGTGMEGLICSGVRR